MGTAVSLVRARLNTVRRQAKPMVYTSFVQIQRQQSENMVKTEILLEERVRGNKEIIDEIQASESYSFIIVPHVYSGPLQFLESEHTSVLSLVCFQAFREMDRLL